VGKKEEEEEEAKEERQGRTVSFSPVNMIAA